MPTPVRQPKGIARPLPTWAFILGLLVIVGTLITLFFTGSDWADGDLHLAFVAAGLAVMLLIVLGIRSLAGMAASNNPQRLRQYVSSILVIIILFTSGGAGLLAHGSLHAAQAHFLENQHQWGQAITEYQLAGEKAPSSVDLARTYDEWGEDLSQNKQFQAANGKFDMVQSNFSQTPNEVSRAQKDETQSYINWGKQEAGQHHYTNATSRFDYVLSLSYCGSDCKAEVSALDATAYYNQAETMLSQKNYQEAVTSFKVVQNRFPQAPEASKQHKDMSKALLGKGKEDKSTLCETALPVYQELATKFADTPEGLEAKAALSVPQPVLGHFVNGVPKLSDGYVKINASLLQNLSTDVTRDDFYQQMANAPTATISDDGHFKFQPLKPGTYDLVWGFIRNDGYELYMFYHSKETNQPIYVAQVGQLCPFDFGDIQDPFMQNN
ncbi:hypothetical protein KSZ_46670 [Dictyobacter formicarum]|uniref:Outer membrane lipoprotein BamD-like domain-containing protein n=2 Tax=Dictyobacter formicarum TaxID=2778368 RepID=A0ABQ3VLV2_9CHLR|nr:hypothetical protein KSZ_46670 [Dictyobacter formicarum]